MPIFPITLSLIYIIIICYGNHFTNSVNKTISDSVNKLIANSKKVPQYTEEFKLMQYHTYMFKRAYKREKAVEKTIKILNCIAIIGLVIFIGTLIFPNNIINSPIWLTSYSILMTIAIVYSIATILNYYLIDSNIKQANKIADNYLKEDDQ